MYYPENYNKASYGAEERNAGMEMLSYNIQIQADRITKLEKRVLELEVKVARDYRKPLFTRIAEFIQKLRK